MFHGACELQLDCVVEENSGSGPLKLALSDLPDDFHAPPHNGSALPMEPSEIKPDPAAADTSACSGEGTAADSNLLHCSSLQWKTFLESLVLNWKVLPQMCPSEPFKSDRSCDPLCKQL